VLPACVLLPARFGLPASLHSPGFPICGVHLPFCCGSPCCRQRQSEHLSACHARAVDIIAAIASSSKAAAAKGSTAAVAEEDDGDEDADAGEQEKQQQDGKSG